MKKPNPLKTAISQILEILDFIQDHKNQKEAKEIPPHIIQELERLETGVELLQEVNEMTMKSSGITPEEMERMMSDLPSSLSPNELKVVKRAMSLKKELLSLSKEMEARQKGIEQAIKQTEFNKGSKTARAKKFKPLGGRKNWKPI